MASCRAILFSSGVHSQDTIWMHTYFNGDGVGYSVLQTEDSGFTVYGYLPLSSVIDKRSGQSILDIC